MAIGSEPQPRVLIVDDEAPLLHLMSRFVAQLGYQVETASTGGEAWEAFSKNPSEFALVIADLTLPDVSGQELLNRMLGTNPSLRLLVCSGYPANTGVFGSGTAAGFLQKPFLPKMLEAAVKELMEGGSPS